MTVSPRWFQTTRGAVAPGDPFGARGKQTTHQLRHCATMTLNSQRFLSNASWVGPLRPRAAEAQKGSLHPLNCPNEQPLQGPDRAYLVTELSGILLRALRQQAEAAVGELIQGTVITVPANSTTHQRRATKTRRK